MVAICPERERLGNAYLKAVHELHALLQAQAEAVIGGDDTPEGVDLAITAARTHRNQAKRRYTAHLLTHDC
jgi:hypothetical protein